MAAVEGCFGSFDAMRAQLTAATVTVQGSGWGVLGYEPVGRRLLVEQVYDHQANVVQGLVPLLAFDAWEHAYYLQYENRRPDYVESLWEVVDWDAVAGRFGSLGAD
jgi:Fe-Mn family superoxide dismutase